MYCIRVDGASDEGPSHHEVQFLWTEQHLVSGSYATVVTCRNSGGSYLNRVELQNGCLALGHANLCIPSTLGGSCVDSATGKIDEKKLKHNMDLATDVYLSRVDGSPCGETTIRLFKGADSSKRQRIRPYLIQFLKGSNIQREALQAEQLSLYTYFEKVWRLRNNHMVQGLPAQYIFYLLCSNCKDPDCPHTICQSGRQEVPTWYEHGPTVSYLLLPIPDTSHPWGSTCSDCKGCCYGHYLKPKEALTSTHTPMSEPPSVIIGTAFKKLKGKSVTDNFVEELARKTPLPPDDVRLWLSHLETVSDNRKRGAKKASETRRLRKQVQQAQEAQQVASDVCYCGICHEQYIEYTDVIEKWICCDTCNRWYHFSCVGLTSKPDDFVRVECS